MAGRYNPEKDNRRSIRLQGYDYSRQGAYFVTICTRDRQCLFGEIKNGEMHLNETGHMVQNVWNELPAKYSGIDIDESIIMPNHMHGIIMITDTCPCTCRGEVTSPFHMIGKLTQTGGETPSTTQGGVTPSTTQGGETPPLRRTLGQIVAYYKYQTTKQINKIHNTSGMPVWQRNYYERIIRDESELNRIRQYIINNPFRWDDDENNPANLCRGVACNAPTGRRIINFQLQ